MRYYNIQIGGASSSSSSSASASTTNGAADDNTPIGSDIDWGNLPAQSPIPGAGRNITVHKSGGPAPSAPAPTSSSSGSSTNFSSLANGVNDPGALDIEFEFEFVQSKQGLTNHLKIKGIDPQLISQANSMNSKSIKMWGGFSPGLPLATDQAPHQGLLIDGTILPAFGNWIGNELSLEFFITPTDPSGLVGGPTKAINLIHNMPKSQPLSTAIQNTLQTAFKGFNVNINISDKLKLNYDDQGFYQGLEQYGNYIKALSHSILGVPPNYKGVTISTQGNNIHVSDGTKSTGPVIINYQDLIGQPAWITVDTIQVKLCLRGDIQFPDNTQIQLPKTLVTLNQATAITPGTSNLIVQGIWDVIGIRHIGSFRSPSAESWVTIVDAVRSDSGGGSGGSTSAPSTTTSGGGTPLGQGGIGHPQ